jgi:predicted metal-dependent peptidase
MAFKMNGWSAFTKHVSTHEDPLTQEILDTSELSYEDWRALKDKQKENINTGESENIGPVENLEELRENFREEDGKLLEAWENDEITEEEYNEQRAKLFAPIIEAKEYQRKKI